MSLSSESKTLLSHEETMELIGEAQKGNIEAKDILVTYNLGLIRSVLKGFMNRGYEVDDLFQIGSIGLLKAIDKFDTSYDVKFSTYAVPMIVGEIKRFLRDDGIIKVSRTLKENTWKINQTVSTLTGKYGREPTIDEISQETGIDREDIVMTMESNIEVESIHKTVYQNDGNEIYLLDKLAENGINSKNQVNSISEDREKDTLLNHMVLQQLLEMLDEKEKRLIKMRYFMDKTQMEVAKDMGISQVQVSRMEKKILLKLRGQMVG